MCVMHKNVCIQKQGNKLMQTTKIVSMLEQLLLPPFDLPNPSIRLLPILIRIHSCASLCVCSVCVRECKALIYISPLPVPQSSSIFSLFASPLSLPLSYSLRPQLLHLSLPALNHREKSCNAEG